MTYQCPRHHSGSIGEKMIADETTVLLIHTQVSLSPGYMHRIN